MDKGAKGATSWVTDSSEREQKNCCSKHLIEWPVIWKKVFNKNKCEDSLFAYSTN